MYNSQSRLNEYKRRAAGARFNPGAENWRGFMYDNPFKNYMYMTLTRGDNGKIYADSLKKCLGDYCGDSEKLARLDHNGWYADHYCDETIKGGVIKLRTAKGVLYIPVISWTNSDGITLYFNDAERVPRGSGEEVHEKAINEAARSADHYAERVAEDSREYAAKDQAEQDISQARETIHETNKTALNLLKEIKQAGQFSPGICAALKTHLNGLLSTRADCFKTIEKLKNNYWLAVENF